MDSEIAEKLDKLQEDFKALVEKHDGFVVEMHKFSRYIVEKFATIDAIEVQISRKVDNLEKAIKDGEEIKPFIYN